MNNGSVSSIAVIGSGVIGLTTAELLLENGFDVTVYSRNEPRLTSSYGAGAYWWPHRAYPQERVSTWAKTTYERYKFVCNDGDSGVFLHEHFRYCEINDETSYALDLVDHWCKIAPPELDPPIVSATRSTVPMVDVSLFMPWLRNKVSRLGARFINMDIANCKDLFGHHAIVINCSGLGAKQLENDNQVYPIRGQIVRVEKPANLTSSYRVVHSDPILTLILPRVNDCVLGGTVVENSYDQNADEDTAKQIIERCARVVPELKNCRVLGTHAALRPARPQVRLELDSTPSENIVIHNYGHGGSGYTICYGCAAEVVALVQQC